MAAFLSQAWVDDFNRALVGVGTAVPPEAPSLRAESGHLTVLQHVHDVPHDVGAGGVVRTLLRLDGDTVHLALLPVPLEPPPSAASPADPDADVTIIVGYAEAAAMSRGELEPAEALGTGRIKVRGDLSVLVAAQAILTGAANRLATLRHRTSY